MSQKYDPINPKCPHMLHGGDYNPDQWIRTPEVWDEDVRLMELAGCNAMSVGIFAWAALEPEEGRYEFGWLDAIMDKLAGNGAYAVLATPSGSKPAWMSEKYPEVRRVDASGHREPHAGRHNHCRTSPVYREKCVEINTRLARRYSEHPALLVWHVSNEYNGGECHCDLCLGAFRDWLREKYDDDLDKLNHAWWTGFWSHTFTSWEQIRPVDGSIHGMMLDWKRFITDQTIDFFETESAPLREYAPDVPVTTNFMGIYPGLNYPKFARHVDVVSWDSYPAWHDTGDDPSVAAQTAFVHDVNRSMKGGQPFMLMESTPSFPSRGTVRKRKRPGMHLLSSLQAVAHGSDTVQYFQWRKGRGGCEKFHGAVVDHVGHENTRVFRDVADVGEALKKLDGVVGASVSPEVAIIYDWENRWAMEQAVALGENVKYPETCMAHYRPFWERGIPVDVIDATRDFSGYRLMIAPMLYMLREGIAERIAEFVRGGGTVVTTYWSGMVDRNDLCFRDGFPAQGLREVFGVWAEETDVLHSFDENAVAMAEDNVLGLSGSHPAREICALIHAGGAEVLGTYEKDFYVGRPALTMNTHGDGQAYYVASRNDAAFLYDFYGALVGQAGIGPVLEGDLPEGVTAQVRTDGERRYVFLMNFNPGERTVDLGAEEFEDMLNGEGVTGQVRLEGYGIKVLTR